jgi:hypothetical protein
MINAVLKYPFFYRFYQKIVRKKFDEYIFFKFLFKKLREKNKIRMLDICCADSYILNYVSEFLDDYLGVDNNIKYLNQSRKTWKDFNFFETDLNNSEKSIKRFKEFNPNLIFVHGAIHHFNDATAKIITTDISKFFSNSIFISTDPINHENNFLNKIMINFDRGKFIRTKTEYNKLMPDFEHFIIDDFYRMSFKYIFHFKNLNMKGFYHNWKKEIS